ncbi:MAG: hypothetical protein M3Y72_14845 [Acidobacteriota bacterium]|nr:hypothetical protein [Acidobacteriota bacterium]
MNTGTLQWGSSDGVDPGGPAFLGALVNKGSIFIAPGSNVSVNRGVTDIPKGASWEIAGGF